MLENLLSVATLAGAHGRVTVRLVGEIDVSTASAMRDAGLVALDQHGRLLTFDMSGVTFMDSSGVGALIAVRRAADRAGGRLQLVNPPRAVARVLQVTGLDSAFDVHVGPVAASA